MADVHLNRQLLASIFRGERSASELLPAVMAHLSILCPRCRTELEAWHRQSVRGESDPYGAAFDRVCAAIQARVPQLERERQRAEQGAASLLELPAADRLPAVQDDPQRYRGPALAQRLIAASLSRLPADAQGACNLAQLATAVLHQTPPGAHVTALYARALAHMANALKAQGRLQEADAHFRHARFVLRFEKDGDPLLSAELDELEGSLRRHQRRLDEARHLLRQAVEAYRMQRQHVEAARALLSLGMVHREADELEAGLEVTRQALELIRPEEEPRLCLVAWHNLADGLCDQGRCEQAAQILETHRALYERFPDPWTQLRLAWLEARIAQGLGDEAGAERRFLEIRQGFLERGNRFDAALAALELAALYLEQGRDAELQGLAAELVGVFQEHEVHREALAALLLFESAVSRRTLTKELIRSLARTLEQAHLSPERAGHPALAGDSFSTAGGTLGAASRI